MGRERKDALSWRLAPHHNSQPLATDSPLFIPLRSYTA
jgi:hypothetical protein